MQLTALTPAQRTIANRMLEDRGPDSLDAHVRRLMKDLGLDGFHCRNSIGSRRGFPDWEIWGSEILHRELKTEKGVVSPDQRKVGSLITRAGGDWEIWRPRDLVSGVIAEQLGRIAGRVLPRGPRLTRSLEIAPKPKPRRVDILRGFLLRARRKLKYCKGRQIGR